MPDFINAELIVDFTHQLRARGMAWRFGCKVARVEFENERPVTVLENGRCLRSEMLLLPPGGSVRRMH